MPKSLFLLQASENAQWFTLYFPPPLSSIALNAFFNHVTLIPVGEELEFQHQSTTASTWWCGPRPRLGWVEMAVGLPKGSSYPGHSPSFFCYAAP